MELQRLKITRSGVSDPIGAQGRSVQRRRPTGPPRLLSRLIRLICLTPQQSPIPHLSLRQMHTQSRRHNIIGDRSNNRVRLRETFSSLDAHDSSASCSARLWKVRVCELDNCSCNRGRSFRLSVTGSRQHCSSRGRLHRRHLHLSRRQHVLVRNRPTAGGPVSVEPSEASTDPA
jgi:hypothetical protein